MSNKPSKLKNKSGNSIQVGNFLVSYDKGHLQSLKITAANGNWSIRFREDNPLFLWINDQIKSDEGKNILHLVFASYYAVCSGVPDNLFLEDILKAYQGSIDRIVAARQQITRQEDLQIIEEEKNKYNTFKTKGNEVRN